MYRAGAYIRCWTCHRYSSCDPRFDSSAARAGAVAEETAALDGDGNGLGDHVFPQKILISDFLQRIPRKYAENFPVEPDDAVDEMPFKQMGIKTCETIVDPYVIRSDQDMGRGGLCRRARIAGLDDVSIVRFAAHGIDVKLHRVPEKTPERLQDTALKIFVVLLVEYLQQIIDAY